MDKNLILENFGKLIIEYVYDDILNDFKQLLDGTTKWGIGEKYTKVFNKLSLEDKVIIIENQQKVASGVIFGFLQIFEENENFKLIFEEGNEKADLNKLSEMLKSEHHGDNGWIAKFSKFNDLK